MTRQSQATSLLIRLAEDLADDVVRRYRVGREDAVAAILAEWRRRPALIAAVTAADRPEDVRRLRVYRDAADAVKKDIYHHLRRYRSAENAAEAALAALADLDSATPLPQLEERLRAVAAEHVSTAERMPHLGDFVEGLTSMIGAPRTVLDVGCGVFPVVFPLDDALSATEEYWALDNDTHAVQALRHYARVRTDPRLRPLQWAIETGWPAAHAAGLPERCEVALLLKVVPVVGRRSPKLLTTLAQTPAERLVVSGSRTAMAKHQDIERRETRLLRRFFTEYGFTELDSFRTPDEVLYLVTRS